MLRVQVIDGVLSIAGICGGPTAEPFSLEVTPDQCQNCPAATTSDRRPMKGFLEENWRGVACPSSWRRIQGVVKGNVLVVGTH